MNNKNGLEKLPKNGREVHLEPNIFHKCVPEDCSECGKPTRYWLNPHVPLCPKCAKNGLKMVVKRP